MYIGKVIGTVVATRKDERLIGSKLLLVQPLDVRGERSGKAAVAVDSVGAGVGETVLVAEGSAARMAQDEVNSPVDAAIVGIVDVAEVREEFLTGGKIGNEGWV